MKVLQSLSQFQKSPVENAFIPVNMQMRPRTRSSVTIWNLPEEVLLHLLKGFHIKDLLNMRAVHSHFRDLINNNTCVWMMAKFHDCWPSPSNIQYFHRASETGNTEALIKLAVAYLYNEGLPGDFDGRSITGNGLKAAELFCKIETSTSNIVPFTWLFIRPPWSASGACCKECVFLYMKNRLEKDMNGNITVCVAKTLQLLESEEKKTEAVSVLQHGTNYGSGEAAFLLWENQYCDKVLDKATELESIRRLRDIASMGCMNAKMCLSKYYASGKYGGISRSQAAIFLREVFQNTAPTGTHQIFQSYSDLTPSMRYILVDWLVEVAGMKEFSSLTLHAAVNLVDRFLQVHSVPRSKLQLLGVSAMVVCSRFLGKDIITIREAAWLTDNTYKYEDVVRMMGEITATLKGNVRVLTSLDFVDILNTLAGMDQQGSCLAEYICELCLLQAEMGQYSPTEISAGSVLLARLLVKNDCPWPRQMEEFTGFSLEDISRCAFHLHEKCFLEGSVVDHRDITLQAVKQRYTFDKLHRVSQIEIMSYEELCQMLGVTEHVIHGTDVKLRFRNADELIVSPSRGKSRNHRTIRRSSQREKASTPSLEREAFFDETAMSGYDGDQEDEDSAMEFNDSISSIKSDCSELTIDSDSDTYSACLSSFCQGESSFSGIRVSYNRPVLSSWMDTSFPVNCVCDQSTSSGISLSPNGPSPHTSSKRAKCNVSANHLHLSISCSQLEVPGSSQDTKTRRKSPRTVTQMTSPNALRRKNRKHPDSTETSCIL